MVKKVSSSDLDALLQNGSVVVDFYADWCGPCHALAPELEKVAEAYGDEVTVVKLDVDADPEFAQRHRVMGIPTVVRFAPGGSEVARSVGAKGASALAVALGLAG